MDVVETPGKSVAPRIGAAGSWDVPIRGDVERSLSFRARWEITRSVHPIHDARARWILDRYLHRQAVA